MAVIIVPNTSASNHAAKALISIPGYGDRPVRFEANVPVSTSATPWLAVGLPLASALQTSLEIQGTIDPLALSNSRHVSDLLHKWFPAFASVEVQARAGNETKDRSSGVGAFFSGGGDSFYTAIQESDRITHLIFVTGFDIRESEKELAEKALLGARAAAEALGKPLIEVSTNIRDIHEGIAEWGTHYHGAALAAVAHLLMDTIGTVIVPASYYVGDLHPWGSHPDLDPLWSSSSMIFEHHGIHATRPEKLAAIGWNEAAMDHLRVCWENPNGAYNCGSCEKCLRTMVNLKTAGHLHKCRTLPHEIRSNDILRLRLGHGAALFARENLSAMRKSGVRDGRLELALKTSIALGPAWAAASRAYRAVRPRA